MHLLGGTVQTSGIGQKLRANHPGGPGSKLREESFGLQVGKTSPRLPKSACRPKPFFSECVTGHTASSKPTATIGRIIELLGGRGIGTSFIGVQEAEPILP